MKSKPYNMKQLIKLKLLLIIFCILLTSCKDLFEFSPYETKLDESIKKNNAKNIDLIIKSIDNENKKLSIALISDSHSDYDKLNKAVKRINTKENIDFTVFMGDQADHGLLHEYKEAKKQFDNLNNPFLSVLGNHDCLSNGKYIYNEMYGEENYTLNIGKNIFIFFNGVVWENDNINPDFEWLANTLEKYNNCDNKVIFTHIPHTAKQFSLENKEIYYNIMQKYDVDISIYGHNHGYGFDNYASDSTIYLTVGSTMHNDICYLYILNDQISFEHENF